ncbi:double zinc ribbon domain-containing protein [Thiolapillus sp.]
MVYKLPAWLFPGQCLICDGPGLEGRDICPDCLDRLPLNNPCCPCCAAPLPSERATGSLCGACSRKPPPFARIIAPWRYAEPLDGLLHGLKFHRKLAAGRLLGELLAEQIPPGPRPTLLVPVPRHPRQLRKTGFNHCSEISLFLSRASGIPWSPWLLKKTRETATQHSLSRRERLDNLRGCFAFDNSSAHRHVAVIDDIVTTGATAREAARALKAAGVEKVEIWAVARTPELR